MKNNNFVEDMMTLGSGLLSNLVEARHEIKAQARQSAENVLRGLDLVSRDEFDAAFAMLAKARMVQEELAARLVRIESLLNFPKAGSEGKKTASKVVKIKKKNLPSVKPMKVAKKKK